MDFWWAFIVGVVIGFVVIRAGASGADDWEPQPRRGPDLFTLAVGIALGAALFGDDDE